MASKSFYNISMRIGLVLKRNIDCNKGVYFVKIVTPQ